MAPIMRGIVAGLSGPTGVVYGIWLLLVLQPRTDVETHLVISDSAKETLRLETDWTIPQVEALATTT